MRRTKTALKALQNSAADLTELDRKVAVLERERSQIQEMYEVDLERFIIQTARRNGIIKLSIDDIVAGLDRIAAPSNRQPADYGKSVTTLGEPEAALPSEPVSETKVEVFVKMSNNASEVNRQKLMQAGLHWSGKEAGFVGKIGLAALELIRAEFPDRVLRPASSAADHPGSIAALEMAELTETPADAVDASGEVAQPNEPGKASAPDQSVKNDGIVPSNPFNPEGNADVTASTSAAASVPNATLPPLRGFPQRKSGRSS